MTQRLVEEFDKDHRSLGTKWVAFTAKPPRTKTWAAPLNCSGPQFRMEEAK